MRTSRDPPTQKEQTCKSYAERTLRVCNQTDELWQTDGATAVKVDGLCHIVCQCIEVLKLQGID